MRVSFNWLVRIWNYIVQIFKETYQSRIPVQEQTPTPPTPVITFDRIRVPSFRSDYDTFRNEYNNTRRTIPTGVGLAGRGSRIGRNPNRLEDAYQYSGIFGNSSSDIRDSCALNITNQDISRLNADIYNGYNRVLSESYRVIMERMNHLQDSQVASVNPIEPKVNKEPELKTIHGYAQENENREAKENRENREPRIDI